MSAARDDLRTTAFEGLDGLEEHLDAWNELLGASAADPLFNGPTWVRAHARAFGTAERLFGWLVSAGDGPLALFAFREEPSRGFLSLRRAIVAADGTFDTDYAEPLVRAGREPEAARALLECLAARPAIQAVVLSGVPARSPFLGALREELARRGLPSRERPVASLALELPPSLEAYVASLKPRMRTKVRSALRAAEELGARFLPCTDPGELPDRLEELFRLHGLRWRAAGEAGSFADPRRVAFYREMAPRFLERGELRLSRLATPERTLAAQLGFQVGGTYYQLQEGYDPEHGAQRVGIALRGLATAALIDEGTRRYDFLAGDSRHKRDWGGSPEECVSLAFGLPRLRARLSYGLRALVDRIRG